MSSNRERAWAEAFLRYPICNPGNHRDIDLNHNSRACFAQGYKAALDEIAPEFDFDRAKSVTNNLFQET